MKYLLILIDYNPDYLKYVINSILSVDKDSEILIASNSKLTYKNTHLINLEDFQTEAIKEFKSINIYKDTVFEKNPLWLNSALRVFYLNQISKDLLNEDFIHFDNDILIYKPFSEISEIFNYELFNITPVNSKKNVFGYSFIPKENTLNKICDGVLELSKFGLKHNWEFNNGKPYNEMDFLGAIGNNESNLIAPIPILPYLKTNFIFDPSSYGQYLDGTHMHPKKYFRKKKIYNLNEYIGMEIMSKRIHVEFKKNYPSVTWNNKKFELVNLHIHSKRFEKFLPSNYKNYI
ncbi:hypothetical protein N9437_02930 [Acidimicrobiia bacterium]|nr:hypothetical protein [Acidimicrobiia bacterium]